MSRPTRFGSAISFIALASALAGCAAPQARVASGFGGRSDGDVGLATRALAALNSNDIPTAIALAERAVDKTPNDAGFRGLLGNAYFAGGRFWSAEAAYKDSLSLYSNQPQVVLKLALVEIAQGKTAEAVQFLEAGRDVLDPADYGLALALAGHADEAVAVLQPAARAQGADSRVRQNLALAYALAGEWTNARVVAGQDVPANQLDSRIQQWMQLANPGRRPSDQIAALTGVTPAPVDQGQPIRLALNKPSTRQAAAAPVPTPPPAPQPKPQVAQAAPVKPQPQPQFVEAVAPPAPPPVAVHAVQPAPAAKPLPKPVIAEAPVAVAAPVSIAMAAAASPEAPAAFAASFPYVHVPARVAKPAAKPVRRGALPIRPAALRRGNSGSVMQLGAYGSPQRVSEAWNHLTQRYPALRAYLPMRARFVSPKGTFWRLSITGFDSRGEAAARCQLLKSRGGSCFVRAFAGDAPVEIASR